MKWTLSKNKNYQNYPSVMRAYFNHEMHTKEAKGKMKYLHETQRWLYQRRNRNSIYKKF